MSKLLQDTSGAFAVVAELAVAALARLMDFGRGSIPAIRLIEIETD